jgi:hypothetical protein
MNLIKIQKRYLYVKKDGPRERDLVQHAVIKHWGLSGMPSASLAGKVLIG